MSDDVTLLARFRRGDETAFTTLAERYRRAIHAACQRQAPAEEVDDCVQAVFLTLIRRPAAAGRAPVLLAWLHRVAHFVCRDARRAAARRRRIVTNIPPPPVPGNAPENAVLEQLDAALLGLDERQRAAVLLHASGNANDEIALSLGVTAVNASKLVQRGLAALRDRLCRSGTSIGASMLLAIMTSNVASAATTPPLSIHALNHASPHASQLAKGAIMHLTITSTSTWMLVASVAAVLGLGALVASEAFNQPPTPPRPNIAAAVAPPQVPVPVPVLTGWEKAMDERLQQRVTFDFQDAPSLDALGVLRQMANTSIIVHPDAEAVMSGRSLSFKANDMSLRATLNHIASICRVRYLIIDQAIFFSPLAIDDGGLLDETERQLTNAVGIARETTWGKQILDTLNQKEATFNFQGTSLTDVIDFLQKITNCNFVIDPEVFASAPLVTMRVESMKLRFALNHIMRSCSLRYQLRDEAIFITSLEEPQEDLPAVTIKVTDMRSDDAAKWLSQMTKVPISVDPTLAATRVTFNFPETELTNVLQFMGQVLQADVVAMPENGGYQLKPISRPASSTAPVSTPPVVPTTTTNTTP